MIRRPKRNSSANKKTLEKKESLIRQNSATIYGLYFASSNTDFLLDEKKTRFSLRPSVVVKQDRQTLIFDYSTVKGDEASIFDGFFRGLSAGGTGSGASAGSTLALDGGIESTCNFINDVTGIPLTNFADTYTISSIDVSKKIIVAIKANPITSTTAVMFESNKFIDLPQWTKTQTNKDSTLVNKIINLIPSQSMTHLGVFSGSILEFDRTSKNNGRFTVENVYNQNGFEVIDVKETVVYEDASGDQVIVSVYGEETQASNEGPPVQPAPPIVGGVDAYILNHCCPCYDCLIRSMNRKEAEAVYDQREGCNVKCTDGGTDCGPYQIDCNLWSRDILGDTAKAPCRNGVIGGASMPECCEINQPGFCNLGVVCPDGPAGDACCAEKQRKSKLLIRCYLRRWNRNQGNVCKCSGNRNNRYDYPSGRSESIPCCTCEDIARRHQGGAPGGPCRDTDNNNGYWKRVKFFMSQDCPECNGGDSFSNDPDMGPTPRVR